MIRYRFGRSRRRREKPSPGEVPSPDSGSLSFADPALDAAFARDGFVVLPLLDARAVEQLRAGWHAIAREHDPVWDPTGFAATVRHRGVDVEADALIRPVVAAALAPVLRSHEPFMAAYLLKSAGSEELPAHLDWRLVDEPGQLSAGCWVPLERVDAANGALGVVRGSHLRVDFDRTPEEPGHEWVHQHCSDEHDRVLFEVDEGVAVIYDHRLVHFSPPNTSAEPRLACNTGLATPDTADVARARLMDMMARAMGLTPGSAAPARGAETP